jgi:2',3'-cyclic-nucleotide 2'-phosphodiesterase (5'-nucleotidase family)
MIDTIDSRLTQDGLKEGTLGNAITDSMVENGEWEDATIGFMNNGGIRWAPPNDFCM